MPQIAALTIGTSTYTPFTRVTDGVAFNDVANAASVAVAPTLISQTVVPKQRDGVYRVKLNINTPVTCATNVECADTAVKSVLRFKGEFLLPATSTQAEREAILALVSNALTEVSIKSTVENLESFY